MLVTPSPRPRASWRRERAKARRASIADQTKGAASTSWFSIRSSGGVGSGQRTSSSSRTQLTPSSRSTAPNRTARPPLPAPKTRQRKTASAMMTRRPRPSLASITARARAGDPPASAGPIAKPSRPMPPANTIALAQACRGTPPSRRAICARRTPAPQPAAAKSAFEASRRCSGIAAMGSDAWELRLSGSPPRRESPAGVDRPARVDRDAPRVAYNARAAGPPLDLPLRRVRAGFRSLRAEPRRRAPRGPAPRARGPAPPRRAPGPAGAPHGAAGGGLGRRAGGGGVSLPRDRDRPAPPRRGHRRDGPDSNAPGQGLPLRRAGRGCSSRAPGGAAGAAGLPGRADALATLGAGPRARAGGRRASSSW